MIASSDGVCGSCLKTCLRSVVKAIHVYTSPVLLQLFVVKDGLLLTVEFVSAAVVLECRL